MRRRPFQPFVVELADIESFPELLFGAAAKFFDLQLADFISKCLSWPGNVTVDFNGNVMFRFRGIFFEEIDGLLPRPAERVHPGIDDQSDRAPY